MISVIVGKKNTAFEKQLALLTKGFESERISATDSAFQNFYDEVQTPSLFGEKKAFIVSDLFESEDDKKKFLAAGEELSRAPHDVIVLLESILVADLKKIEAFATVYKIALTEKKTEAFNAFALANAFSTGDRKKSWIIFQELLSHDDEMEKTHGMLWWKLKDMMIKKSGYSPDALKSMARKLVVAYHESRLGGLGLEERLEEFLLTLPEPKKK